MDVTRPVETEEETLTCVCLAWSFDDKVANSMTQSTIISEQETLFLVNILVWIV